MGSRATRCSRWRKTSWFSHCCGFRQRNLTLFFQALLDRIWFFHVWSKDTPNRAQFGQEPMVILIYLAFFICSHSNKNKSFIYPLCVVCNKVILRHILLCHSLLLHKFFEQRSLVATFHGALINFMTEEDPTADISCP